MKLMKQMSKHLLATMMIVLIFTIIPIQTFFAQEEITVVNAHSGRTDGSGGHKDNKNKSGLGYYHYHCNGNPPHKHDNGVCPYEKSSSSTTSKSNSTKTPSSSTSKVSKTVIKKVQTALNDLGYDCGKADGVMGKKSTAALKEFQRDNGLTVDGKIGKQVKKALSIE